MDPLIWALVAPFVSLSTQLCGLLLAVCYLSYFHTRRGSSVTEKAARIVAGCLLSLIVLALLPSSFEIELLTSFDFIVPIGLILLTLIGLLNAQRKPMDAIYGALLGWGVAVCSPAYATLTQITHQALFAVGLMVLIFVLAVLARLLDRPPEALDERELKLRINTGRIGVILTSLGLLYLWVF